MAVGKLALWVAVIFSVSVVQAQQPSPADSSQTYESLAAKARQQCTELWSDHAFDPIRGKVSLSEDKPTFSMLRNSEKLSPKERPLADLAIKTLEQCRQAWAPVYAMMPPAVVNMIHGVERRQDAVIAELYRGKITFGDLNVAMSRMTGELAGALSGLAKQPQVAAAADGLKRAVVSQPATNAQTQPRVNRVALVIGNSNYANLPKLGNPANDARAVADSLKKLGYRTRLLLDASEQNMRREIKQFASESENADAALLFYAGHGAQVNGNNYVIPIDIDIPRTEVDIQFSALKVDDLVNSIQSNTKIVFLDACRDNPVLFKNIVKGRVARRRGWRRQPAQASTRNPAAVFSSPMPPMPAPLPMMVVAATARSPRRCSEIF